MLLKDTVFFLPPPTFCTEGSWEKTKTDGQEVMSNENDMKHFYML